MIKLSDYVMDFLVAKGIDHLFMVTGGGIMHLQDSAGRKDGLTYICNHHEQACAIAAESYARRRGRVGAILVTTGPGSTNALSAIPGAFVDSVPVFVISGQVRRDLIADYHRLRQLGPQEINILDMVRPAVKYAATIVDPREIWREMERAWDAATSGRPGPVWINIPMDVQGAMLDEADLLPPDPPPPHPPRADTKQALALIVEARRPLWIFGAGIHMAHALEEMRDLLQEGGFPAVFTIGGMDLIEEEHPLNMGRFGPVGQRRANFALQNADLILAVGASLSIASIGFNTAGFAPQAKRLAINIDAEELRKPNLALDVAIHGELRQFMRDLRKDLERHPARPSPRWLQACEHWRTRYPTVTPDYLEDRKHVNTYVFAEALSRALDPEDTVVTGNSLDIVSIYQSFRVQRGQRVYTNINYGAMGWDLPGAIGACLDSGNHRTILVTGDGSIQLNLQELLTIKYYRLNIKIFVVNNQGYEAIRSTQKGFFDGHLVGSDPGSGIGNPDYAHLAAAYGLRYDHIADHDGMEARIAAFLAEPGPGLCELNVSYHQPRSPKASSFRREDGTMESRPLEDMAPFLPREEIRENMHLFDEEIP
jgi:acetolactate synthase-1/2/3 large subunit